MEDIGFCWSEYRDLLTCEVNINGGETEVNNKPQGIIRLYICYNKKSAQILLIHTFKNLFN